MEGKVKQILLGSWVKVDEPSGLTFEIARENCAKPMLSEAFLKTPGRASFVDELPVWKSLTGDLAFFEDDGKLYSAGPTSAGYYRAAQYEYPRMISEDLRSLIVGVHTWSHSPTSGFRKTDSGIALETVPVQVAIPNGVVSTDQFLLQIGQKDSSIMALLLTNVDRRGGRTDASVDYINCEDISTIVAE